MHRLRCVALHGFVVHCQRQGKGYGHLMCCACMALLGVHVLLTVHAMSPGVVLHADRCLWSLQCKKTSCMTSSLAIPSRSRLWTPTIESLWNVMTLRWKLLTWMNKAVACWAAILAVNMRGRP